MLAKMVFTEYTKKRILHHKKVGLGPNDIVGVLEEEGITVSRVGVWKFLKRYEETGELSRKPGSGRPSIITAQVKIVDEAMEHDDETTAIQLHKILLERGKTISLSTILRCRSQLGWTYRGSAYCQLIREGNKIKKLAWAHEYIHEASLGFTDVIYTDETSVQLEAHRRHACRRIGQPPRPKPR